jgi:2-methylcitrate dehydratase PrpD
MNTTSTIAHFVAESQSARIAEPVQDEAVRALVDWLGCCLGGCLDAGLDAVGDAPDFAPAEGEATLPGRGGRSDLGSAVLRSAIAADAFDFAATHAPSGAPLSAPLLAALLPLAEARASTGASLVHAYVLGAEIVCRLAQALKDASFTLSPGAYVACALVGAATACGKLLGLDAARLAHAIGIAASDGGAVGPASGDLARLGDDAYCPDDRSQLALAARSGLTAALLAQRDSAHRISALAGGQGFLALLEQPAVAATLLHGLGEEWHLARTAYKPYPCDSTLHAAIEACLNVRIRHRPLARHITQIELHAHPSVLARAGTQAPTHAAQARRSLQHAVAVSLIDGAAGLEQFGARRIAATRVAEMRSRIELRANATLPAEGARIVLHLLDGRVAEHSVRCPRGNPARPLGDGELSDKFRSLSAEVLATDQAERVLALAWNVRALADIGALVRASVPEEALDPAELPGSPLIPR